MNWCEVNQLLAVACTMMATPPIIARARVARTCVQAFYFADLTFVDHQSTAKTTKICSLENFRPYGKLRIYLLLTNQITGNYHNSQIFCPQINLFCAK